MVPLKSEVLHVLHMTLIQEKVNYLKKKKKKKKKQNNENGLNWRITPTVRFHKATMKTKTKMTSHTSSSGKDWSFTAFFRMLSSLLYLSHVAIFWCHSQVHGWPSSLPESAPLLQPISPGQPSQPWYLCSPSDPRNEEEKARFIQQCKASRRCTS